LLPERRYFFASSFAGSFAGSAGGEAAGVLGDAPPLGCDCAAGGCAAGLAVEPPLGAALEPPEAESDFGVSELAALGPPEAGADFVSELAALDELEPGCAEAPPDGAVALLDEEPGVEEAPPLPPDAEPDEEPGAVEGEELGGVALLELEEPGVEEVLLASRSQAASPKAIATAIARMESFMGPPWLGYERKQQYARPD
jgi:hypothetical protein